MNKLILLTVAVALAASSSPATAEPSGTKEYSRVYALTSDLKPLADNPFPYYEQKIADFGTPEPGEMTTQKKAAPLPEVPADHPEPSFAQECQDPKNAKYAQSNQGWTKDHYHWCQANTMVWEKYVIENGQKKVTGRLREGTLWLGYADPRNRRFVVWGILSKDPVIEFGDYDDDARLAAFADCTGEVGKSACRSKQEPSIGATLDELRDGYREFKTTITDISKETYGLTGDAVASMNVFSWWVGNGGTEHPSDGVNNISDPVRSRCDSTKLRTSNACIFNNVSPYLTYDRADTAFPVGEVIDHIRYAQDTLGAPGKFANGKPVTAPLTRNRNAQKIIDNRKKPKEQCKAAAPNGWNGKKINCDEYPFASTNQGGTSGGPVSGRLINAKVNREGGIQLSNWYGWDRILDGDQFWVQLLG